MSVDLSHVHMAMLFAVMLSPAQEPDHKVDLLRTGVLHPVPTEMETVELFCLVAAFDQIIKPINQSVDGILTAQMIEHDAGHERGRSFFGS